MVKRSAAILIVGLLLASIAGAVSDGHVLSAVTGLPLQEALKQDAQIKEVSGYRQWSRITPEPQPIIFPTEMG